MENVEFTKGDMLMLTTIAMLKFDGFDIKLSDYYGQEEIDSLRRKVDSYVRQSMREEIKGGV